jgi:hypothetical protein
MNLLNTKIQTIEGVSRTETFISLDQQMTDRFTLRNNLQYKNKIIKSHLIHKTRRLPYKGIKLTLF